MVESRVDDDEKHGFPSLATWLLLAGTMARIHEGRYYDGFSSGELICSASWHDDLPLLHLITTSHKNNLYTLPHVHTLFTRREVCLVLSSLLAFRSSPRGAQRGHPSQPISPQPQVCLNSMATMAAPSKAFIPFLIGMMLLTGVCNTLITKYQVISPHRSQPVNH